MLAQERYAAILRMIRETNIVKIGDIAKKLKVSNETARRDLETLQDQKLLKRVHGGAVLVDPLIYTGPQSIPLPKEEVSYDEKSAIGAEAAKSVRNGETIFLDIGSTTLQIAKNLRSKRDLTVLTTSLDIINELAGTQVTLIILGGKLINDDLHIAAPFTEEILARYNVKATFFMVGENIDKHHDVFRQVLEAGHAIGNHTYNHVKGVKTPFENYLRNVTKWEEAYRRNTQTAPLNYQLSTFNLFRPPYGKATFRQRRALHQRGYQLIYWDVLTRDYNPHRTPEKMFELIRRETRPGSIINFHDSLKSNERMLAVLPQAIEFLLSKGYEFKTL